MILLTILAVIALLLIVCAVVVAAIGGTVGVILCSDLIVCVAVIGFVMWLIIKWKNR